MVFLVTGGAGYIGSHTCVELINEGHQLVIVDNLSNSKKSALNGISKITNCTISESFLEKSDIYFYQFDIRDGSKLKDVYPAAPGMSPANFAGNKAVGESTVMPIEYYDNGLCGAISLIKEMDLAGVRTIIFSSSATVYGEPESVPIVENAVTGNCSNPYGRAKYFIEEILKDLYNSDTRWKIAILRYFNPVGAHPSSLIGEDPHGIPANLMPYISKVAAGELPELKIFGDDYETVDGTGVRDYIHVVDLAKGHISALILLISEKLDNLLIANLGTGKGVSVLELIAEFELVSKKNIPYQITGRRDGDIPECWSSVDFSKNVMKWKAKYNLRKMCIDTWKWELKKNG